VAYDAFRLATVGEPRATIDNFTPEQRFFIAFAQSWRTNMRPEWTRFIATADVHSPPRWRVNGTIANIAAFYEAFGCPPPQDMPPSIW
jgi:predicted metalloendopeptidase